MGEVVRFVPKSELERAHLIREARAIYESIFPTANGHSHDSGAIALEPAAGRAGN
jgi:hypothetical protein